MEKILYQFTTPFIKLNPIVLFMLIACPISIGIYSQGNDTMVLANSILKSIGGFLLLCWIIGLALTSNEHLKSNNIRLIEFNYLMAATIVLLASQIVMLYSGNQVEQYNFGIFKFSKPTNIIPPLLSSFAFIFIIITSAKAIVSAEQNKEVTLSEYFKTFLLIVFSVIGLWSIQARIQKLASE